MTEEQWKAKQKPGFGNFPGSNKVSKVGSVPEDKLEEMGVMPVSEALSVKKLPRSKKGLFRHPPTWTEEEDLLIIDLMKHHIPLHIIAEKVNAERHCLSKHIKEMAELAMLKEDMQEAKLDIAESQLQRLIMQGNVTALMYFLEKQGRSRGYGDNPEEKKEGGGSDRIVMGIIPDEDVKDAETFIEKMKAVEDNSEPKVFESDPVKQGLMEEMLLPPPAQEVTAEQMEEMRKDMPQRRDEVYIPPPPPRKETPPFMTVDMRGGGGFEDAESIFADGGDSMFGMV